MTAPRTPAQEVSESEAVSLHESRTRKRKRRMLYSKLTLYHSPRTEVLGTERRGGLPKQGEGKFEEAVEEVN